MEKYYITTAIAYTSRIPHIGNVYEAILTDSIARYKRAEGYDVYFLTGTDEHGQKIQDQAIEEGITPQEHVDHIAGEIRKIWDFMNVSYDQFIRTTDEDHKKVVQKIFKKLYDQGDIYKGAYEGAYCKPCESFWTETQLNDGKCPDCGGAVEQAKEEAYFLKLSNYADRLVEHYNTHPEFISPESRKNEMINNFIKPGLQDLCVSRTSFDWGIPVEFDPGHVTYVWIDALSNYISAIGYDVDGNHGEKYNNYWPADVHVIGKDIVRFHTIYWPIILMALDVELPKKVLGHPWLLTGTDKMSKSKGNVVYAHDLVEYFGLDAVRYYVLREMPYAQDGSFTYENMISRVNTDLANVLGNLVNRTVAMVNKYNDGVIQAPGVVLTEEEKAFDEDLINLAKVTVETVTAKMNEYKVADALEALWTLLRRSNKYIDETCPWILAKEEDKKDRLGTVLYNLLESIRISSVLLESFIPDTAKKIQEQINAVNVSFESAKSFDGTVVGSKVGVGEPLFARIDEAKKLEEIAADIEKKYPKEEKIEYPEIKPEITFDDFSKIDFRVAEIISVAKHKKADRLLVLQLKVGDDTRQVVSGIAEYFDPQELVGEKVILVANLKPVKLRGEKSEGMILAAESGKDLKLVTADMPAGSTVS
ncbi:methionine--tRNA ligase [Acidaminobacter sp. JC074]|uniref:methionine--tRNA ligase n=1 Tax=Acidaminobacter sp. JC074 TaxID=2530199 RepID=UPI001F0F59B6|nr:methionine--tRNA ligase [Acidaminobacter sp. JC074]MCH4891074.1 methionine--tRNA ligase [Acidaminobacter sp. JC074]